MIAASPGPHWPHCWGPSRPRAPEPRISDDPDPAVMRWAVILAGGSGTRFWPLSTPEHPKQLLPLAGSSSTAEEAVERLGGLIPRERILVVAGPALAPRLEQKLQLVSTNMLIE